ncbi:haloacid dehalogenase type II [Noviherbaspirillum sp. DKR-6]|uniref:(S)-2-haloacid dehalogenase n=2 Tax=Noviherbaspirillum pedocola TaxID=2801341 RepID=A0A934W3B8_9BURK|nr:haloacid dehalogenase type II [Noviherbaspirillum pedocola]
MSEQQVRPKVLLFDVNETLLDIGPLATDINAVLGDKLAAKLWFASMLQHSMVMTVSQQHAALPDIGAAVLQMLAKNANTELSSADAKKMLEPMRRLPPHPDVREGLERLKKAGYRLATLTNSSQSGVKEQIGNSGLTAYFEQLLSVESVEKYKPSMAVYEWAASQMQVEMGQCMLVAAHGWDVAGAKWAGMRTAFIARAGQQLFPLAPLPDYQAADMKALAEQLGG